MSAISILPLASRPYIAAAAPSVHGYEGRDSVERYHLPEFWCLHVYRYEAVMFAGEARLVLKPGVATLIPPDTPLEYHYRGLSPHFYVHFKLENEGDQRRRVPLRMELGEHFGEVQDDLRFIAATHSSNPLRAEVRLWELLWTLAERADSAPSRHPALERAVGLIELRLAQTIEISKLAREAGISHNHLIRLFQAEFGSPVAGYIRGRRAERARHLLTHTSLPIKVIARQVGVPDLRAFNALMKQMTGRPPRNWRS